MNGARKLARTRPYRVFRKPLFDVNKSWAKLKARMGSEKLVENIVHSNWDQLIWPDTLSGTFTAEGLTEEETMNDRAFKAYEDSDINSDDAVAIACAMEDFAKAEIERLKFSIDIKIKS